jgi:hypothetical protein
VRPFLDKPEPAALRRDEHRVLGIPLDELLQ